MELNMNNYLKRALAIVTLVLLVITGTLQAQFAEDVLRFSTFNLGIGARSAGMGNTSTGIADDFSSLFTNPAGLTSLRNFEFSLGLSNSGYSNEVNFFGANTSTDHRVTNLSNLGLVYPVPTKRGSLTFALGFSRVSNFASVASFKGFNPGSSIVESLTPNVNLDGMSDDGRKSLLDNNIPFQIYLADSVSGRLYPNVTDSVQQEGTIREGGGLNSWSFGGAIEVSKGFSLGVGFNIISGSYSYDRVYTETDARNIYHYAPPFDFSRFRYDSNIESDLSGYNLLVGLMYRKQGKYRLGMTVRTPTYYRISENFSDVGNSWFDNGDHFEIKNPGSTDYDVQTPFVISVGGSAQVLDWLVLAGDAEYTDWTEMEFSSNNQDLIEENRLIRDLFRATTALRGGVEVTLFELGLQLRGGVVMNPSPYKNDPSDYDQMYYTAGIGASVDENVSLNASVAFGTWKSFRDNYFLSGLEDASRTRESIKTNSINVSLSYRF